ncbi:hypothetical protein AVEN_126938-1 [Araneus ventricosus]|uniref:Uncharacterized protein n=1 Tax=Araneus ventricosus TaxID=182803 RepID=A0A4Y2QQ34_ARAVE|nr:hypothetical protein AVEN_126938-1 [Araneus ventricosus]
MATNANIFHESIGKGNNTHDRHGKEFVLKVNNIFIKLMLLECSLWYRLGGLVVRFRLRCRRVPSSKPDSTEDLISKPHSTDCMWACCTLNRTLGAKRRPVGVVRKFVEGVCQLRGRPRHLTYRHLEPLIPMTTIVTSSVLNGHKMDKARTPSRLT